MCTAQSVAGYERGQSCSSPGCCCEVGLEANEGTKDARTEQEQGRRPAPTKCSSEAVYRRNQDAEVDQIAEDERQIRRSEHSHERPRHRVQSPWPVPRGHVPAHVPDISGLECSPEIHGISDEEYSF